MDVISLTRELLSYDNINPPGNEGEIARFTGRILAENGFRTDYYPFEEGRLHLVAERGLSDKQPPVVLSGHFDTVPLGNKKWNEDPFSGHVHDGKIWGRGSSDMKGGLAAMILASVSAFELSPPPGGIRLIFSAAEELGCIGIQQLAGILKNPGKASAVIVGEPTSNHPFIGHKGALYINVVTKGITAHSSMPHLGDNAIYKAARSILKAKDFQFMAEKDPLLGFPTINVGRMSGGMNINSVPDHAEFSIDIRSTSKVDHSELLHRLTVELGQETALETLVNMGSVHTREDDPFVQLVYDICRVDRENRSLMKTLPYLTDGSVLQRLYKGAPTIILGPGQPEMAHQTDEFCFTDKLEEAVNIYREIIIKWRN
ncbi:MAG: M20 family metallopeptidase [Bacteroidales bacterium]|nr:M20 family metallopeptidase [Bacteroidales bacterium]